MRARLFLLLTYESDGDSRMGSNDVSALANRGDEYSRLVTYGRSRDLGDGILQRLIYPRGLVYVDFHHSWRREARTRIR